jgi:predicted nucleotidyltransferase
MRARERRELSGGSGGGRGLLVPGGLLTDLQSLLGTDVDVVESESIHPCIRVRVLQEAVLL